MDQVTVFDWAQVKLAEEYIKILMKTDLSKQHIVSQLANAGGVNVIWDKSGSTKLEGSWEHILKAQVVFQNYLRSLSNVGKIKLQNSATSPSGKEQTVDNVLENDLPSKSETSIKIKEENEVYVNITLSGSEISALNQKPIQMLNGIQVINCKESEVPKEETHPNNSLNIHSYRINSFQESFIPKADPNTVKDCITKECLYSTSRCQQNVFYKICSSPSSHIQKSNCMTESSSQHTNCGGGQCEIDDGFRSAIENTDNRIENVPNLVTVDPHNEETIDIENSDNSVSGHGQSAYGEPLQVLSVAKDCDVNVKSKYLKKKDYEELAPYKFFCSLCSFKSKRESHFQRHMKLHNKVSELFKCSYCSFTSIRLSHLRRHELKHSNLTLSCNICQYHTNNQKLLIRHKRVKHCTAKMSEMDKEILHCVHCEYHTTRYHFLQRHMRVHVIDGSVQVHQCQQCSYKTNRKEHFVRHTNNIHKGQRPFLCHLCGKAFKRQDALKQHSSVHLTHAAVSCPECGKGCRSQTHLSQHMSVHSSDRAFLCELCGASFKTRAVQRKHMLTIHQHPKAFLCCHCSRKFSTKFALRRHIKQHSLLPSLERKPKHQSPQITTPMLVPEGQNAMRLVAMDTVFFSESTRARVSDQTIALSETPQEGEKITLQLTENYEAEALRVIPAQTVMQPSNETTAVVYLAGTFAPMSIV